MDDMEACGEITAIWDGEARNDIRLYMNGGDMVRLVVDGATYEAPYRGLVEGGYFSTHYDATDAMNLEYLRSDLAARAWRAVDEWGVLWDEK